MKRMKDDKPASEMENKEDNQMPEPKIKHDWYQTETHVIVTILVKNIENVKVEYRECSISVSGKLSSGSDYSLELDLAHYIAVDQCSYKIFPSRIEIKLKKVDGIRWTVLEGIPVLSEVKPIPTEILQASNQISKYPSSSKQARDWDKVGKEIERQEAAEETQGEAAVNALFQKIYGTGSDDVRRAMNKSFIESGGTVLSTNWQEVGHQTVEKKPPDGMEWKTWDK